MQNFQKVAYFQEIIIIRIIYFHKVYVFFLSEFFKKYSFARYYQKQRRRWNTRRITSVLTLKHTRNILSHKIRNSLSTYKAYKSYVIRVFLGFSPLFSFQENSKISDEFYIFYFKKKFFETIMRIVFSIEC